MTQDHAELHTQVSSRLTRHDHRYTGGRRRLVEALAASTRPVTLPEIVAATPDLAQSSAYRNLDVLEQCGVIRRISVGGDHSHFELAEPLLGHHHHLICVDCGVIEDIQLDDKLEQVVDHGLASAARAAGFTPLHHSLDLHGQCPRCTSGSAQ